MVFVLGSCFGFFTCIFYIVLRLVVLDQDVKICFLSVGPWYVLGSAFLNGGSIPATLAFKKEGKIAIQAGSL